MGRFIINGGKRLSGEIVVDGSKNAALPIIFSTIAIDGVSRIENLPDISDVDVALEILRGFCARTERKADTLIIDTRNLKYTTPDEKLVSKIRASSYLIGACLSRFGIAEIQHFGGCNFDNRPIDMHLSVAMALGASLSENRLSCKRLCGADIFFDKISVGATVNALILCASAVGKSRIFGFAREPHVISLIDFLNRAGADISVCTDCIEINGKNLSDSYTRIIPDMIEAGTYLALSLATDSRIKVTGADLCQLASFTDTLKRYGAELDFGENYIIAKGRLTEYAQIKTAPYPAFPTDLQPQTAPLLALFCGGRITEGVWHNRFGYLKSLSSFGVDFTLGDGFAEIKKSVLHSGNERAPDLRGGVAMLICALVSFGESVIEDSEIIKRGYTDIVNKLRKIGAEIDFLN